MGSSGEGRREGALHVGSQVWAPYLIEPVAATITEIIVHTDGRLYAKCMDCSGNERAWYGLEELSERSGGDGQPLDSEEA